MATNNLLDDIWIKWRYKCASDNIYREVILDKDDGPPTHCYDNAAHGVSGDPVEIERKESTEFKVKEETKKTNGNFQSKGFDITAGPQSTTTKRIFFPYGISIYNMRFNSDADMYEDELCCSINTDYPIGSLTSGCTAATSWAPQNYVEGDYVTLTHDSTSPFDGITFTYTCILDTVGNATPLDPIYWRYGYRIDVSPSILTDKLSHIGFNIKLDDTVNIDDCGEVVKIDSTNNQIWLNTTPINSYATGTTLKQTIYNLPNRKIGSAGTHDIGSGKIGATFLEAFYYVDVTYKNNHATKTQTLAGDIDITYGREAGT